MTGTTLPVPDGPVTRGRGTIGGPPDFAEVLRSLAEFTALDARTAPNRAFEARLTETTRGLASWVLPAWCRVCDKGSLLHVDMESSDGVTPNFWDRLICPGCDLSCRQRFLAEQFSAVALAGSNQARTVRVDGDPGAFGSWVSTAAQSYPGLHIDLRDVGYDADTSGTPAAPVIAIFSIDTLINVPDLDAALRDFAEALSPGGRLLLSVPFFAWDRTTASLTQNAPAEGVWRHQLGWDLVDRCIAAGFSDAYVLAYWSSAFGYLGGGAPLAIVAERAQG